MNKESEELASRLNTWESRAVFFSSSNEVGLWRCVNAVSLSSYQRFPVCGAMKPLPWVMSVSPVDTDKPSYTSTSRKRNTIAGF